MKRKYKFRRGDRVVMIKTDPWTVAGSCGTVVEDSLENQGTVVVRWDRKSHELWHDSSYVELDLDSKDPNYIFKRKRR